jgi:hypothetical protein
MFYDVFLVWRIPTGCRWLIMFCFTERHIPRDADGLLLLFLPSYAFFGMLVFCFLPTKHSCGMQAVSFMFVTKHCILWDESFSRRENRLVEKCGYVSITSLRDVP